MRCSKAQSYLSQELDEQLPADVTGDLDRHLDTCAACREYRADLAVGQRLLAAAEPELPDNFEWKLQLRLNQALRESAGEHLFPWQEEEQATRWAFLRSFGAAAAVGLAAVLALAVFMGPQGIGLPVDTGPVAVTTAPAGRIVSGTGLDEGDRRGIYTGNIFQGPRAVSYGARQGNLLGGNWSNPVRDDGLTILHLQNEVRRLRTENFQQRQELEALETRLDTVPGASLDLQESR